MEREPLLPIASPRWNVRTPPPVKLAPVHEEQEHVPLTPSQFKDRIIFGPAFDPLPPTPLFDALNLSSSPRHVSSFTSNVNIFEPQQQPPPQPQQQNQQWLVDPNYKGRKSNLHRSKTAPAMAIIGDYEKSPSHGLKPQPESQSVVKQAVLLLFLYLVFGIVIYWCNKSHFSGKETHPVVDALYFCIVTMCTIGYGDITPDTATTKLFSVLFVLVGFGFIDILLSGMVTYVLDLQENYLLRTVKAGGGGKEVEKAHPVLIDYKKGRMRIRMKVALALGVVVLCIGVGLVVMHYVEDLGWLDSFYLSVMSVTTVGYGDRAFTSLPGRVFASIWLLVSTLAVARAFLYLAEARVDKRNRRLTKWVLGQKLTISQFLAADMDHNGFVSKSEYVIYKLKEMGKISDKDILQICNKFDQLDPGNCGKITLGDLMHGPDY